MRQRAGSFINLYGIDLLELFAPNRDGRAKKSDPAVHNMFHHHICLFGSRDTNPGG